MLCRVSQSINSNQDELVKWKKAAILNVFSYEVHIQTDSKSKNQSTEKEQKATCIF